MARPPSDDPRTHHLPRVRATSEEFAAIMGRVAISPHATYAAFARDLGMNAMIIQREPLADQQLLHQLGPLGNNANQSAKALNILALSADAVGDPKLAAEVRAALEETRALHAHISSLIEGLLE